MQLPTSAKRFFHRLISGYRLSQADLLGEYYRIIKQYHISGARQKTETKKREKKPNHTPKQVTEGKNKKVRSDHRKQDIPGIYFRFLFKNNSLGCRHQKVDIWQYTVNNMPEKRLPAIVDRAV